MEPLEILPGSSIKLIIATYIRIRVPRGSYRALTEFLKAPLCCSPRCLYQNGPHREPHEHLVPPANLPIELTLHNFFSMFANECLNTKHDIETNILYKPSFDHNSTQKTQDGISSTRSIWQFTIC